MQQLHHLQRGPASGTSRASLLARRSAAAAVPLHRPSPAASSRRAVVPAAQPLDVIIVGSGIGGLVAAKTLVEIGANVRVYESKNESGALDGPGGIFVQVGGRWTTSL